MRDPDCRFLFGNFSLDTRRRALTRDDTLLDVGAKPLDLLEYLLRNRDRVTSADELIQQVWSQASVSDAVLSTALYLSLIHI